MLVNCFFAVFLYKLFPDSFIILLWCTETFICTDIFHCLQQSAEDRINTIEDETDSFLGLSRSLLIQGQEELNQTTAALMVRSFLKSCSHHLSLILYI